MRIVVNLAIGEPLLSLSHDSSALELTFRYYYLFLLLPASYYDSIENAARYGKTWILVGFVATLVAGILVHFFSGSPKEKFAFTGLSIALASCISFVVYAASTNYGAPLDNLELRDPNRLYWIAIAQYGLLVLGGGFAGNLLLDGMKKRPNQTERTSRPL